MMTKINTSNWEEFVFGEVFEMQSQKEISPIYAINNSINSDIQYPFLGQSRENNCIISYLYLDNITLLNNIEDDTVIIIHSNNHLSFCINTPFYLKDGHGATSIFKNKHLNEYNARFIITVLNKTMENLFDYDVKATKDSLKKLVIKLPSTSMGEPDWSYMETYMKKLIQESETYLQGLKQVVDNQNQNINISDWKEFVIGDLFKNIVKPNVLHSRQVIECDNGIPYVVRTKFNNGIKYRVQQKDTMNLSPGGVISFGAENPIFFYQEKPFVSGRDIYYIDTQDLSASTCRFLTACLQPIARKYSYNNGLFPDLLRKEIVKLPVSSNGQPNWNYMEQYMDKIISSSAEIINNFERLRL